MVPSLRSLLLAVALVGPVVTGVLLAPAVAHAAAPTEAELVQKLKVVDDRQMNNGDWKSLVYIEQKEQDKSDLVYQASIYRRDLEDKLVILFLKPQAESGKGYLRVDNSLFLYDPTVGRWERRTERERIGGTGGQRQDFDQSRLAEEYTPKFVGEATLGAYQTWQVRLTVKTGVDVAYPTVDLWIDQASGNVLKRQDLAESGRLMRTTFYPEWQKLMSPSKGSEVYFAKKILIYDEIEKGNSTTVVIQNLDLAVLDDSIFTKAWLESKSR